MSENQERNDVRRLIRRFWWVAVIIILLLIFLCGITQAEQILKLYNPSTPTPTVSQPPNDTVTEPPKTQEATEKATDEPPGDPTEPGGGNGDGACNAACDPQASNCLAGLNCVPKSTESSEFICWNADICLGAGETPVVTEGSGGQGCTCRGVDLVCPNQPTSFNSAQCGGSGICECRDPNKTWACPDGTYADFNPNCGVGGTDCSTSVCYDGMCRPECGETPGNCGSDCYVP